MTRTRLQGWRALPPAERPVMVRLLVGLPLVALALRVLDYRRTRALVEWLSRHPSPRAATAQELREADRLAQLAATAGNRGLVQASCLRQALLVHGMLRRRGLAPELKLGVRREGEAFLAHAWVELAGTRLAQSDVQFASFDDPSPGAA